MNYFESAIQFHETFNRKHIMDNNFLNQNFIKIAKQLSALLEKTEHLHTLMKKEQNTNRGNGRTDVLKGWVFTEEVKEILGVSTATIYRYIREGLLPASKFGSRLIFRIDDIMQIIDRNYKRFGSTDFDENVNEDDDDQDPYFDDGLALI